MSFKPGQILVWKNYSIPVFGHEIPVHMLLEKIDKYNWLTLKWYVGDDSSAYEIHEAVYVDSDFERHWYVLIDV